MGKEGRQTIKLDNGSQDLWSLWTRSLRAAALETRASQGDTSPSHELPKGSTTPSSQSNKGQPSTTGPGAARPHHSGWHLRLGTQLLSNDTLPYVFWALCDHTAYQFMLPHLETQSSGKNMLFSVWPGSSAIACNFG